MTMSNELIKELFSSGKQAAGLNNLENICTNKSSHSPREMEKAMTEKREKICWKLCRKSFERVKLTGLRVIIPTEKWKLPQERK